MFECTIGIELPSLSFRFGIGVWMFAIVANVLLFDWVRKLVTLDLEILEVFWQSL